MKEQLKSKNEGAKAKVC